MPRLRDVNWGVVLAAFGTALFWIALAAVWLKLVSNPRGTP